MSPIRYRRRLRLGPIRVNVSGLRVTSLSVKVGPWTWNPRRGRLTTNLPGGLYHEHRTRRQP